MSKKLKLLNKTMGNKASSKKSKSKKGKNNDVGDEFEIDGNDDNKPEFESAALPSSIQKYIQYEEKEDESSTNVVFGGNLSDKDDNPLTPIDEDMNVPTILVLLKKYLFQYNGYKLEGIFANGSINDDDIKKSPEFIEGEITMKDCETIQTLIEKGKIGLNKFQIPNYKNNDKYYGMIFAELIKIWLSKLNEPLLQPMPSTFFDGITEIEYLEYNMDTVPLPEPQGSTLIFLWDLLAKVVSENGVTKMDANKLSIIFSPLMYKDADQERNAQILQQLTTFFAVGIEWRIQENK